MDITLFYQDYKYRLPIASNSSIHGNYPEKDLIMFIRLVFGACTFVFLIAAISVKYLPLPICLGLGIVSTLLFSHIKRDRWAVIRTHSNPRVRMVYKHAAIYNFVWRLDKAYASLSLPEDALDSFPGSSKILDDILDDGPDTYQKKVSNRLQIESLLDCVFGLVQHVRGNSKTSTSSDSDSDSRKPIVLDIGAGKALFTRAVYEALDRRVAVIALDARRPKKVSHKTGDMFYDPVDGDGEEPYTRIVADVRYLAAKTLVPLRDAKNGGAIAITKHLCGGATDGSIIALCKDPLMDYIGACCFAPCCHQKTRKDQYCNIPYLESMGFCRTHIGLRGGIQDTDFKNFGMLISMSRAKDLQDWEYKKSHLLDLLGFARAAQLGRQARRIFEEGRIQYLRKHGFDAKLVRYCDESITGDNLAIIATKRRSSGSIYHD